MSEKNIDQTQDILKHGFSDVLKPKPVVNLNEDGGPKRPKLKAKVANTATWQETQELLEQTKANEQQLKETLQKQLEQVDEDSSELDLAQQAKQKWLVDKQESIEISKEKQYYLLTDNFLSKITDLEASTLKSLQEQFSSKDVVLNAATVAYNDKIQNIWTKYKQKDIVNVSAKLINLYNYLQDRVVTQDSKAKVIPHYNEAGDLTSRDILDAAGVKSATQYILDGKVEREEFFNQAAQVVMTKNYDKEPFIEVTKNGENLEFSSEEELYIWWLELILVPEAMLVMNSKSKLYEAISKSEKLKDRIVILP